MRAIKRLKARGFTLVELMIVVAIIGVLAALAIFGVRKYLAAAKSGEARNTLGAVNRASVAAYERERVDSQLLPGGTLSAQAIHALCDSAQSVPQAGVPQGKKYQPLTTHTGDFNSGNSVVGWRCLRFSLSEPHYYQYAYTKGGKALTNVAGVPASGWSVEAKGDLDGDGTDFGEIASYGDIENGFPKVSTVLYEQNTDE